MRYELIADALVEKYNTNREEILLEWGPITWAGILAAGAATSFGFNWYIKHFNNNKLPEILTKNSDEWWFMVGSFFDPTGLMSQPYFKEAEKELAANPDDTWLNIKYWLTFMATIPLTNFNPFSAGWKLVRFLSWVTGTTFAMKGIIKLFSHMGGMLKGVGAVDRSIPIMLARMGAKDGTRAAKMRNVIEKAFNIKILDSDIIKAAKAEKLTLKTGLVKGVGAVDNALETAAKLGVGATKLGAKAGKLIGTGAAMAKWYHQNKGAGSPGASTSGSSAPDIFGFEGGKLGTL